MLHHLCCVLLRQIKLSALVSEGAQKPIHLYIEHIKQSESAAVTELVEAASDKGRFQRFAEKRLLAALAVYRQRNWRGHVRAINCALARLYSMVQIEDARRKRFDRLVENWGMSGKCVRAVLADATRPSSSSSLEEAGQLLSDFADVLKEDSSL